MFQPTFVQLCHSQSDESPSGRQLCSSEWCTRLTWWLVTRRPTGEMAIGMLECPPSHSSSDISLPSTVTAFPRRMILWSPAFTPTATMNVRHSPLAAMFSVQGLNGHMYTCDSTPPAEA
jgi:hypothetical protein